MLPPRPSMLHDRLFRYPIPQGAEPFLDPQVHSFLSLLGAQEADFYLENFNWLFCSLASAQFGQEVLVGDKVCRKILRYLLQILSLQGWEIISD